MPKSECRSLKSLFLRILFCMRDWQWYNSYICILIRFLPIVLYGSTQLLWRLLYFVGCVYVDPQLEGYIESKEKWKAISAIVGKMSLYGIQCEMGVYSFGLTHRYWAWIYEKKGLFTCFKIWSRPRWTAAPIYTRWGTIFV